MRQSTIKWYRATSLLGIRETPVPHFLTNLDFMENGVSTINTRSSVEVTINFMEGCSQEYNKMVPGDY